MVPQDKVTQNVKPCTLLLAMRKGGDSLQEEGGVADVSAADRPPRCAQRRIVCTGRVTIPNSALILRPREGKIFGQFGREQFR